MKTSRSRPNSPDSDSLALKKAIDALCDQFEDAFRAGKRPDVAKYLAGVAPEDRPRYLRELLLTQLALNPQDRAASAAYLKSFPDYRQVVVEVFDSLAEAGAESTNKLQDSLQDLVRGAKERLRELQPTDSGSADGTLVASARPLRLTASGWPHPGAALWSQLVRHARLVSPSSPSAGPSEELDLVVHQLLSAFPETRRQLLADILLDAGIREVASHYGVTERTVEATCRTALAMLGGERPVN